MVDTVRIHLSLALTKRIATAADNTIANIMFINARSLKQYQ